ncbi:hypothetical protein V6R21_11585 [Limibacter armeniacum]|uniref:helix-turn-helix transcriptional regulator n=1 Tax=Limibacter armeniacum TaxID=466084 RepID=UPI002FE66C96
MIDERCMTAPQLAEALGRSVGSVYQLKHKGVIPFYTAGGPKQTRYDLEEVKTALSNHYRQYRGECISEMRAEAEFQNRKRQMQ